MTQFVGVNPAAFQVGNTIYKRGSNEHANDSAAKHVQNYLDSGVGAYRFLKIGQQVPTFVNAVLASRGQQTSPALAAAATLCRHGWSAMGVPRVLTASISSAEAHQKINAAIKNPVTGEEQAPSSAQKRMRVIDAVVKGSEAVALSGYVTSMFSACSKATSHLVAPFKNMGDVFTLVHDSSEAVLSVDTARKARKVEKLLLAQGIDQSSDIVRDFRNTKVNSALKAAKAFLSTFSSIVTVALMVSAFKATLTFTAFIAGLGLVVSFLAVANAIHKQTVPGKLIDMTNYYDLSRPALPAPAPAVIQHQHLPPAAIAG